jgi:hypothetical protein
MVSPKAALILVGPMLLIGISSVFYWNFTENLGHGDLRLYGIVQFLPLILIALIFLMYKFPENYLPYIIGLMVFYALSRVTEFLDYKIYETMHFISGHTFKHLLAAAAACCLLIMLKNRAHIQS